VVGPRDADRRIEEFKAAWKSIHMQVFECSEAKDGDFLPCILIVCGMAP